MKKNYLNLVQVAVGVTALIGFAGKAAGLPACPMNPNNIIACGCAITKSGSYTITTNLTENASQDCIDIGAPNVNLRVSSGSAKAITGSGSGVGINVLKSAANANLQLVNPANLNNISAISGFQTGIEVQGSNVILNGFVVSGSAGDGLQIKGSNCSVMSFTSNSNGGNGVTISGSSGCQLNAFTASGNTGAGVGLINAKGTTLTDFNVDDSVVSGGNAGGGIALTGSSSNTISNFAANNNSGPGVTLTNSSKNLVFSFDATGSISRSGVELAGSSSNSIFDFTALDNMVYGVWLAASSSNSMRFGLAQGNTLAGIYLGCGASGVGSCASGAKPSSKNVVTAIIAGNDVGASLPQAYGVAVDRGDLKNNISGITATGDTTEDLDDENANCGTNIWFADAGIKVNPPGSPSCTEP